MNSSLIRRSWASVWLLISLLATALGVSGRAAEATADPYVQEVEKARETRRERLLAADGWLSLIGLHWLTPGESTVGRDPSNSVVLRDGPAHWGRLVLNAEGRVTFQPADLADLKIDGVPAQGGEVLLRDDGVEGIKPTRVQAGPVNFQLLDRSGRKGLRVRSENADTRIHFLGIDYFPISSTWRIEAEWVPIASARQQVIKNILGQTEIETVPGEAVFVWEGTTVRLLPVWSGAADERLFFVISDATSGNETYSAARFVYADPPKDGKVILDFNLAVNPPCAFTPYATCPLPPEENQLTFAVRAGEKRYRGEPAH